MCKDVAWLGRPNTKGRFTMDLGDIAGKAKDLISGNPDKVEEGIDKAAELVDDKTGGKFTDQIDGAADKLKDMIPGSEA
jgi:ABC-type transporter Mla subunit MlaD